MWNPACQAWTKRLFASYSHRQVMKNRYITITQRGKNSCCTFGRITLVSGTISCLKRTEALLGALYRTQLIIFPQGKTHPVLVQTWQNCSPAWGVFMFWCQSKSAWKYSIGKYYSTCRIHQTLVIWIFTCSYQLHMDCLSSTYELSLFVDSLRSSVAIFICYQKDKKRSG